MAIVDQKRDILGDKWILWFFCETLADKFNVVFPEGRPPESYEVILTVNGVDLDAIPTLKFLGSQWQSEVRKAAEEMIKDSLGEMVGNIMNKAEELSSAIDSKLGELHKEGHW